MVDLRNNCLNCQLANIVCFHLLLVCSGQTQFFFCIYCYSVLESENYSTHLLRLLLPLILLKANAMPLQIANCKLQIVNCERLSALKVMMMMISSSREYRCEVRAAQVVVEAPEHKRETTETVQVILSTCICLTLSQANATQVARAWSSEQHHWRPPPNCQPTSSPKVFNDL